MFFYPPYPNVKKNFLLWTTQLNVDDYYLFLSFSLEKVKMPETKNIFVRSLLCFEANQ